MNPAPNNPPTDEDLKSVPWERQPATLIYRQMAYRLEHSDFILAMHGSLARGQTEGNDLDLVAFQWKVNGHQDAHARVINVVNALTTLPHITAKTVEATGPGRWHVRLHYTEHDSQNQPLHLIDLLIVLL